MDRKSSEFHEAVRLALVNDPASPRMREMLVAERGVVPFAGRRDLFLLAAGWWPSFFRNWQKGTDEDDRRVHLYVDTSGSTASHWSFLYGLVLHLQAEIGDPVFLFSNAVAPISLKDLAHGRVLTTGGTDFDCVAEHALSRHSRRILVATDGQAPLDGSLARRLRREGTGIFVVLTRPNEGCPLLPLARKSWVLPRTTAWGF